MQQRLLLLSRVTLSSRDPITTRSLSQSTGSPAVCHAGSARNGVIGKLSTFTILMFATAVCQFSINEYYLPDDFHGRDHIIVHRPLAAKLLALAAYI